jgi:uncharacterized protein (TIGR02453 family)
MTFRGFPAATTEFLLSVRANNSREWLAAHRDEYERCFVGPAREFVLAAGELIAGWAPRIEAQPRILGSIFRITADTRFQRPAGPLKDHIDFWFWEGERRMAASGYFMRVTPELVGIGAGKHDFDRTRMAAYRRAVEDPEQGGQIADVVDGLEQAGYEVSGGPRGSSARNATLFGSRDRLVRHRALYVHHDEPGAIAHDGERLMAACGRVWRDLAPLHRWLVDTLQTPS